VSALADAAPSPPAARPAIAAERHVAGIDPRRAAMGEEGGAILARPAAVQDLGLDDDEIILLLIGPSLWFVPFSCLGAVLAIAVGVLAMTWASRLPAVPWSDVQALVLGVSLVGLRLAWQFLEWSQRLYVLTDRRVVRRSGVLRAAIAETSLDRIRHIVVVAARRERAVGVGTAAFVTEGAAGLDWTLAWETVRRPDEVQSALREAVDRYGR
jgi:hypothetical protein